MAKSSYTNRFTKNESQTTKGVLDGTSNFIFALHPANAYLSNILNLALDFATIKLAFSDSIQIILMLMIYLQE